MAMITSPVKLGVTSEDVGTVQTLLKAKGLYLGKPDNKCGPKTVAAIKEFQAKMKYFEGKVPDGTVSPGGPTWQALNSTVGTGLKMSPLVRGLVRQIESRPEVLAARAAVVAGGWALKTVKALGQKKITPEMLKKIFTTAPAGTIQGVVDELNANLGKFKLDTPLRLSHFFAQIRQENGNNLALIEDLSYGAAALKVKFSYFRNHPSEADQYGYPPGTPQGQRGLSQEVQKAIADRAYCGPRVAGNGGVESGDGWRYRGRGLKQLTGKANYADLDGNYARYFNEVSPGFVGNPDLLGQPKYAPRAGVYYWLKHKLYELADKGAAGNVVDSITNKINPGDTDSLADRRQHFSAIWNAKIFGNP
jgi:predicted chitinase